jgi:outer membrane lipoprotein SlyB
MIKRFLALMAVCGVFFVLGCASGESYTQAGYNFSKIDKVAVVEIVGDIKGETAKQQVFDYLAMELLKKGYNVIERQQVQSVLEEQDFQRSDLTTTQGAAQAGRILNVPAVMVANINVPGERISMTVKMIDTETASIVWMGSGYGTTGRTLATLGGAALGAGAGTALGGDSSGKVVGGVAGGVLGGMAGHGLSPQIQSQVQKVIQKICAGLPPA